jgi:nitrite reductase/ring-hydroxylating ferredoxin subunit
MPFLRKPSEQPLWRDEFSVFTADERYVNRRQFTKFLTLTSLAMLAGNVWILVRSWFYRIPAYPEQTVARADEIPEGEVKIFHYPGPQDDCILVCTGPDTFAAYSQKCTHLSCAVHYESGKLACPCHNGYFSVTDGRVLQGPPQRPLPRVVLERRGADLVAVRMQEAEA